MSLNKIRPFRDLMRNRQTAVYSYRYAYNGINCFVAICLLVDDDKKLKKAQYALVRIRFMKVDNLDDFIDCYANTQGLLTGVGEIRRFFHIPYNTEGFSSWLDTFYDDFNENYPSSIEVPDNELHDINIRTVCEHEGRNPNRIYRHHLLRHLPNEYGETKHRTEYNSQLAKWRFPKLWDIYSTDKTVSFAFTDNPDEELSEPQIYDNFIKIDTIRKPRK